MEELRHTPEREAIRDESFKESQKRGVFVDEFGCENPHLGMGSCRPATKGELAEKLKRPVAANFVHSIISGNKFVKMFQQLEKKYGRAVALQLIDNQLVDLINEKFKMELDLQIQQIHEWYGK